ncbi:MAG TPA: hypothetical protein V6D29_00900 [Leptolyngbyaceae cyanobacterium]
MFTGLDFIVLALAAMAVFYLANPGSGNVELKIDPLAVLLIGIIVTMFLVTVL